MISEISIAPEEIEANEIKTRNNRKPERRKTWSMAVSDKKQNMNHDLRA